MARNLVFSPRPTDALVSIGALLAGMPAGRARVIVDDEAAVGAYRSLGAEVVFEKPELWTDPSALEAELHKDDFAAVLLPQGLAFQQPPDPLTDHLIANCRSLAPRFPYVRWLQWYDQPEVAHRRGRYPELAFARRVRGLAEVDEDASMFSWKPVGAPTDNDPLSRKLDAILLQLPTVTLDALFFRSQGFDYPDDAATVREHVARVMGQREWLVEMGA